MKNLFDGILPIHEQYDLKGSTVGRHVELPDGKDQGDIALKDNDFKRAIKVGIKRKAQLLEQIENDTKWLESLGICDYSFLVGYCFLDQIPNSEQLILNQEKYAPLFAKGSLFNRDYGGLLSVDQKEIYFIAIIDTLTTYNFKKMGEFLAKSLYNPSDQISAISPQPYRKRFLKYIETIIQ